MVDLEGREKSRCYQGMVPSFIMPYAALLWFVMYAGKCGYPPPFCFNARCLESWYGGTHGQKISWVPRIQYYFRELDNTIAARVFQMMFVVIGWERGEPSYFCGKPRKLLRPTPQNQW